jgi:hypothetical protein
LAAENQPIRQVAEAFMNRDGQDLQDEGNAVSKWGASLFAAKPPLLVGAILGM